MADIIHRIGIQAPISKVYAALSTLEGVAGWSTQHTTGSSKIGGAMGVRFHSTEGKEIGSMDMELMALDPHKKVHWRFTSGRAEWVGTDVIFNLLSWPTFSGHQVKSHRAAVRTPAGIALDNEQRILGYI